MFGKSPALAGSGSLRSLFGRPSLLCLIITATVVFAGCGGGGGGGGGGSSSAGQPTDYNETVSLADGQSGALTLVVQTDGSAAGSLVISGTESLVRTADTLPAVPDGTYTVTGTVSNTTFTLTCTSTSTTIGLNFSTASTGTQSSVVTYGSYSYSGSVTNASSSQNPPGTPPI